MTDTAPPRGTTRWKAAALHLALTAAVLAPLALVLLFSWYPSGLWHATGGAKLLLLTAGISLVLGPLLTLIVYRAGKKSLTFDLTVIVLLQLAALGYGLHRMWETRPVFLVGLVDRLELVFANEIDERDLAGVRRPDFRPGWKGPHLLGAVLPTHREERLHALLGAMEGKDLHLTPRNYVEYEVVARDLALRAQPLDAWRKDFPATADAMQSAARATGRDVATLRFLPVTSRRGRATALVDSETGEIVRFVAVDPWPDLPPQGAQRAK